MIRKLLSIFIMLCMVCLMPNKTLADEDYSDSDRTIKAAFVTDLNVNKASKGQVVQFVTTEGYYINGMNIPEGTIFSGKIHKFKKGRWAYRRAKVKIVINEMILPNGQTYKIKGHTKRRVLKGSAIGNICKGIITLPPAIVVGTAGACVIIVETVSIAGLLVVGPTSYLVGETMGKLTHGINCKKSEGDKIKLRVNFENIHASINSKTKENCQ